MVQRSGLTRPGGRTARTADAVYTAARQLLAEQDGGQMLVADIATRAGVSPVTIYRRWGSIDALLLEIAVTDLNDRLPVPATGDLRRDLSAYARRVNAGVSAPRGTRFLRAIITATANPATGTGGALDLVQSRLAQFQALIDAATPASRLTPIDLVDNLLAPIYFRALASRPSTLTNDDLDRLVANLIAIDTTRGH